MPQQEQDIGKDLKRNFNLAYALCVMHQRGIVVIGRSKWGTQALGLPCFLSLVLMLLWHMFTQDPLLLCWIGLWLMCFICRRIEAVRLARKGVHSYYDGLPGMLLCRSEQAAKRFSEPIQIGILGMGAFWFYQYMGWRPTGLPYFLLAGLFTLPFVEFVKQTIWNRKIQAMQDARIEQSVLMEDFQQRFGR